MFLPDISYCSPTVVPPPVHSSPTVRYHLHSEYTVRPVCETPSRTHSDTHLLKVGIDFPPCGEPSSVSVSTPFSITPPFRYRFTICMTLSSFTCFLSRFKRIVWFSVSKYFDKSNATACILVRILFHPSKWRLSRFFPDDNHNCSPRTAARRPVRRCVMACWKMRSFTVGMPSFRIPPSGLGISTRLTGVGGILSPSYSL